MEKSTNAAKEYAKTAKAASCVNVVKDMKRMINVCVLVSLEKKRPF